jgi:tetratricopeptide (TPR) repeat protein
MSKLTIEEIHRRFSSSNDFNEIFDAFEAALNNKIEDIELYRLLFWNDSLTPEELCLFGEKLVQVFPVVAFDVYIWLAKVFEVTYSMYDNCELALQYYTKAALINPESSEPYIAVSDCYDHDLKVPSIDMIIDFVIKGSQLVNNPSMLYKRLAELYEKIGDDEQSDFYRRKAEESGGTTPEE